MVPIIAQATPVTQPCAIRFSQSHSGTYIPVFDDLPSLESTPIMRLRKTYSTAFLWAFHTLFLHYTQGYGDYNWAFGP